MPPLAAATVAQAQAPLAQFDTVLSHPNKTNSAAWWLLPVCMGQLVQLCILSLFVLSSQFSSQLDTLFCLPFLGTLSLFLLSLSLVCLPVLLHPPLRPVLLLLNCLWLLTLCLSIVAWLIHSFVRIDSISPYNLAFSSTFLGVNLIVATLWLNRLFLIFRSLPDKMMFSVGPLNAF